jgi:siroheme decarboxylase
MKELADILHDLPFVPDPWDAPAAQWGTTPAELLSLLKQHQARGLLREIGPIFNLDLLGYRSTLAAAAVPADRVDDVAEIISRHPGVSHNYLREGSEFNLWFTLAVPGDNESLARELEKLSAAVNLPFRRFDTVTRYKISFTFTFTSTETTPQPPHRDVDAKVKPFAQFEPEKQNLFAAAVEALQQGLPLEPTPFRRLAEGRGLSESDLLQAGAELKSCGILRRFGAVWRHRKMGLAENILCLWQMPEDRMESFTQKVLQIPHITHCYRRTTCPDWPWQIYTMIHGPTLDHCQKIIADLNIHVPQATPLPLRTIKEYKKSRVLYTPKSF